MAAEQFAALSRLKTPVFEIPGGDVFHVGYNQENDTLDVGQTTEAGLAVRHSFPFDHDISIGGQPAKGRRKAERDGGIPGRNGRAERHATIKRQPEIF